MSRRKLHFRKILGEPAAPREKNKDKKPLATYPSGCGGDVMAALATLPGSNVRSPKTGLVHTIAASEETFDKVKRWLREAPKQRAKNK